MKTKLRSFKEVTGGLTTVIVTPRLDDTKNITEISKELAKNYLARASKDNRQRHDQYAADIVAGKKSLDFRTTFRKIANRAAGVQRANCRDK